jgi:hypothetical protein
MGLMVDLSGAAPRLDESAFAGWAARESVFVSSEMQELAAERAAVTAALRDLGLRVVLFEDLGGRDDDAERAYLDGVTQCPIYLGIVGDRYGTMLDTGRSPTHEEYRLARKLGKRISVWVAADGSSRQGDARDFVSELQVFHTTGRFNSPEDLATRIVARMREIAADAVAPWIKIGDAVVRATSISDDGRTVGIEANVYDAEIVAYLESLRPANWGGGQEVGVTDAFRSGAGRVTEVRSNARSTAMRSVTLQADVRWSEGDGFSLGASTAGYSPEDQVELGLRAGLFGEQVPETFRQHMGFMLDVSDPLEPLRGQPIPEDAFAAVARLLLVERLLGSGKASRLDEFLVGPVHQGTRPLSLSYTERQRYSTEDPGRRHLDGRWSV